MKELVGVDIKEICYNSIATLLYPFINYLECDADINKMLHLLISNEFKYCPICIQYGYHPIYNQFSFIDKCLIHNVDLVSECPNCGKSMDYEIIFRNDTKAFCCNNCKRSINSKDYDQLIEDWFTGSYLNRLSFNPYATYQDASILFVNNGIEEGKISNLTSNKL
jgi:hypothetical protein